MVNGTMDMQRFAKIIELSGSDHDGEALSALRKAQQMLKQAGLTWTELLTTRPEPDWEDSAVPMTDRERWMASPNWMAFERGRPQHARWIADSAPTFDFANSLMEFVASRGYLTPKQEAAVSRAIARKRANGY